MDFEHKVGIGGRLVGIGKRRLDGTEEFTWLDDPIHNTIVGSGFDQLFKFTSQCDTDLPNTSGRTTVGNDRITFTGSHRTCGAGQYDPSPGYGRIGALTYCRIGTDGTATTATDTDLLSPCSGYSSTIENGIPWTYAILGQDGNGDFRIRITHRVTATSDASVREIGWFGGSEIWTGRNYYQWDLSYNLFSRIVLRTPYEVGSGEQMIVTYELSIKYADLTPTAVDMGIDASDGTPLKALRQFESSLATSTSNGIEYVSGSRFGIMSCSQDDVPGMSAHYSVVNQAIQRVSYSLSDRDFKQDRNVAFGTDLTKAIVTPIVTKGAMVAGSGTRLITFTLPTSWPCLDDTTRYVDIHILNIDGYTYRFGYYDNSDPNNPVWVPQAWRKKLEDVWQITEVVSYMQI